MSISNGAAPEYGEAVERALCDLHGLEYVDGKHTDARTSDGTAVQIKGTQRWISNGNDTRTRGRITMWSKTLVALLHEDAQYLIALYDADAFDPEADDPEDVDPEEFIIAWNFVDAEDVGRAAEGSWVDGHRPAKGEKGRFRWAELEAFANEVEETQTTLDSGTEGAA